MEEQKALKKDKECRLCKHIFDCDGKPPGVKLCIRYEERERKEDGGS